MHRSQSVHLTWWTMFNTSHTLSKASTWTTFGTLDLVQLHFSCPCLSQSCLLFLFSIVRIVCIHAGCIPYAYTHLEKWARMLFFPSYPTFIHNWGFPNCISITILNLCKFSKPFWCVPHHLASIVHNSQFRASKRCYSGTSRSNLFRNSSTVVNPSYIRRSLTSVVMRHSDLIIMLKLSVVTSCN